MARPRRKIITLSLSDAEAALDIHRDTLSKRLTKIGEKPDENDRYTIAQICKAVYGDAEQERMRLNREQADRVAMDNEERRRNLIPVDDALGIARKFVFAARSIIVRSELAKEEKNSILAELRALQNADFRALPDVEE